MVEGPVGPYDGNCCSSHDANYKGLHSEKSNERFRCYHRCWSLVKEVHINLSSSCLSSVVVAATE